MHRDLRPTRNDGGTATHTLLFPSTFVLEKGLFKGKCVALADLNQVASTTDLIHIMLVIGWHGPLITYNEDLPISRIYM